MTQDDDNDANIGAEEEKVGEGVQINNNNNIAIQINCSGA
jgi:hypothetical protein